MLEYLKIILPIVAGLASVLAINGVVLYLGALVVKHAWGG